MVLECVLGGVTYVDGVMQSPTTVLAAVVPAALPTLASNSLKVIRVNAGETAYEAATGGAGGGLDEAEILGRMCAMGSL